MFIKYLPPTSSVLGILRWVRYGSCLQGSWAGWLYKSIHSCDAKLSVEGIHHKPLRHENYFELKAFWEQDFFFFWTPLSVPKQNLPQITQFFINSLLRVNQGWSTLINRHCHKTVIYSIYSPSPPFSFPIKMVYKPPVLITLSYVFLQIPLYMGIKPFFSC